MTTQPTPEETAQWQRRLASQANNRAWDLCERASRTAAQDEEMLQAAHAAMHFWRMVGTEENRSHAALLVAHAYGLLGQAQPAQHFLDQATPRLWGEGAADWERALTHAVAGHVAWVRGDAAAHQSHHQRASDMIAALPDPQDRQILEASFRVLPVPGTGGPASPCASVEHPTAPAVTGHVIYAKDLVAMRRFYVELLGLAVVHSHADHAVLEGSGAQLVLHAIPAHIAADIHISQPPVLREEQAIKPFYTVPSLHAAVEAAQNLGGGVAGPVWDGAGYRARNAYDPEGNIIQLRAHAQA